MASSSPAFYGLLSPLSSTNRELSSASSSKLFYSSKLRKSSARRCGFKTLAAQDPVPEQFRAENLSPEMMENYKNVPSHLFGLKPSRTAMFMPDDDQQEGENREDLLRIDGSFTTRASGFSGRTIKLHNPDGKGPPDLPTLFLSNRIIVLAMPITPAVKHLITLQFLHLNGRDPEKPITLYINCPGVRDYQGEVVGDDDGAYAIANLMTLVKPDVYTINMGQAQGQAAMLLSLGKKGHRAVLPCTLTTLYLPKAPTFNGQVSDVWKQAQDVEFATSKYLEYLSMGTGKSKEELEKEIQYGKVLTSQQAIDFGLADKILYSLDGSPGKTSEPSSPGFAEKRSRDERSEEAARV